MLRRRLIQFVIACLVVAGIAAGSFWWGLRQVPDFYQRALARHPDPEMRQESAKEFDQRAWRLVAELQHAREWSEEFLQDDVNNWLAEELHSKYPELVPPGIEQPRVMLREGDVQIGFRYEDSQFQGIISLEVRPWVPEANLLAIEVRSVKAGLIPIPLDQVIEEVTRRIQSSGWRVEWKEVGGNDVLLVHLDRGASEQPVLERIDLAAGSVRISGTRKAGGSSGTPQPFRISSLFQAHGEAGGE
ncbi:MAG: hypothetical protein WD066_19020 [Planctomycetaceae bacterium]